MKRGVSFEIPQKATDSLWEILRVVDIYKYFWYVIEDQTEVWDSSYENDFFRQRCYAGKNFAKCIQQDHHIIFLKLQAYLLPHAFQNVLSCEEFMAGDCQLVMLIHDCENVEVYIKDRSVLDSVFNRANALGYYNVNFITDLNDTRTKMNVL